MKCLPIRTALSNNYMRLNTHKKPDANDRYKLCTRHDVSVWKFMIVTRFTRGYYVGNKVNATIQSLLGTYPLLIKNIADIF